MYALVDCNNFYVSCERVFQPQLNGKPVVVLSNNDGCVISRSSEAKDIGIFMGIPEFKCKEIFQRHQVKVFSSNYALYGNLSNRVMKTLTKFTPNVEVYSIDESFLNFDGMAISNYNTYGIEIKNTVQKWVGIPVCIGFAKSKTLSKVANRIAKKFPDITQGIHVIDTEEKRIKALKWTKIEDVWGIGRRLSKKMIAKNIHTAYDFTLPHNESFIKREMGIIGTRMIYELNGNPIIETEDALQKKSIAITRSFEKNITTFSEMKERISTFAMVCSEKLRDQKSCCCQVSIFIQKDKYKETTLKKYTAYKTFTFGFPTHSGITLTNQAIALLKEIFEEGALYKKAGVIVTHLIPEENKQFNLFEEENPKHQLLMEVIDAFHKKTGERKIKLANQDLNKTWKMRQRHLSRRYTSNINEILDVKC